MTKICKNDTIYCICKLLCCKTYKKFRVKIFLNTICNGDKGGFRGLENVIRGVFFNFCYLNYMSYICAIQLNEILK